MVISYDTSPTLMHDYVIWYITFHQYLVRSYYKSPTIDSWSFHMIHHLPSVNGHIIWYITYIDAWLCHMIHHLPSILGQVILYITYHRCMVILCHMIHHLPSMHGHVIWYITYHRFMVTSSDTSPTGHFIWYITYHRCMVMLGFIT